MTEGYGENFRGGRGAVLCFRCPAENRHLNSQEASYEKCEYIKNQVFLNLNFDSMFQEHVDISAIKEITKILNIRGQTNPTS